MNDLFLYIFCIGGGIISSLPVGLLFWLHLRRPWLPPRDWPPAPPPESEGAPLFVVPVQRVDDDLLPPPDW